MRIRTIIEKRIVTETEVSEEIIRKIENRVLDRLSADEERQTVGQRRQKKNER